MPSGTLEPVFNTPGKRGRRHGDDLRVVVDAMLYIVQTGCQWRYLPESFGPWTRLWSQFRRWSRNGTWARALTVLHAAARGADGRAEAMPSMVVIDTHSAGGCARWEIWWSRSDRDWLAAQCAADTVRHSATEQGRHGRARSSTPRNCRVDGGDHGGWL
jgi:transposase